MKPTSLLLCLGMSACTAHYTGEVIDAHAHYEPGSARHINPLLGSDLTSLREQMRQGRVSHLVLIAVPSEELDDAAANESLHGLAGAAGEVIVPVGTLNPDDEEDTLAQMEHLASLGFRGVRIVPPAAGLDTAAVRTFARHAAALNLVIIIDGWFLSIEQAGKLALSVPQVKLVLAHLGGFRFTDALAFKQLERYPTYRRNVWFDFSSIVRLYADSPYSEQLSWVCRQLGSDRLLFGSDYPLLPLRDAVEAAEKLRLTPAEQQAVFSGNARALFRIR